MESGGSPVLGHGGTRIVPAFVAARACRRRVVAPKKGAPKTKQANPKGFARSGGSCGAERCSTPFTR
jgi:hypothetical protein